MKGPLPSAALASYLSVINIFCVILSLSEITSRAAREFLLWPRVPVLVETNKASLACQWKNRVRVSLAS